MDIKEVYERLVAIQARMERERLQQHKCYRDLCELIEEIEASLATL